MFTYSDVHRNHPGEVGIRDRAQVWKAGGHSNSVWFMDSVSAPLLIHILSLAQCLSFNFSAVAM